MSSDILSDLYSMARGELRERWEQYPDNFGPRHDDPADVIHEVADGCVPVYTSDLLRLAVEDVELATAEPELGPAFDGAPTPTNIIAANVYDALTAQLWAEWSEIASPGDASPAEHDRAAAVSDAEKEGYAAGAAAGSWAIDGNTSEESARRLLAGIEDGDPAVMEALPWCPLSGEWADGMTPGTVLAWYDLDEASPDAEDVLAAFEEGYDRGVLDEVTRAARAILGEAL